MHGDVGSRYVSKVSIMTIEHALSNLYCCQKLKHRKMNHYRAMFPPILFCLTMLIVGAIRMCMIWADRIGHSALELKFCLGIA